MERITFPTTSPFLLRDVRREAGRPVEGCGHLFLPDDLRPGERRPAMVVMEGLGGLIAEREFRYGEHLAAQGHVVLVVDSFGPRGAAPLSHPKRAMRVTETMMLADAYGALRWLAGHPAVDPARVAIMGFSYGGMVSVIAAYRQVAELFAPDGPRFAGHVGYYGCCIVRFDRVETTGAPVMMVTGEWDANISIDTMHAIADDLRRGGSPVTVRVYPGAYHQWDGADVERRHVTHSLARCSFIVEPGGRVRDGRTGLAMTGPVSRRLILLLNVGWAGYDIQQNLAIREQSDDDLAAFLARLGEPVSVRVAVEAARPVDVVPVLRPEAVA